MTTESPRPAPFPRVPGLRAAVGSSLAVGAAAAVAAALVGGAPEVRGAVVGAGIVTGFFLFGTLSTGLAAAYVPQASLVVALLTYTLQVLLLGLLLVGLTRSGVTEKALDVGWLAGTVIVGTLVWTVALLLESTREVRG